MNRRESSLLEPHKQAEIDSRTPEFMAHEASKPFGWCPSHFIEWATVATMLDAIDLSAGATVLDIGSGSGWTSLFLAEAGYAVTGYDLVPANVELARRRAARWGSTARFEVGDMEALPAGEAVDGVLLFDALHHSGRQLAALQSIAQRLRPGGWLLLGEPTWLHRFSPEARDTRRERGWMERGLSLRTLRRDLAAAGFTETRRFFQPTNAYTGRLRGFAWQLARLIGSNFWVAPQTHIWLAARRG
ncbi:MAG: class I SAM-dependent methyltransferase [Solirubrobacteraceae bacterium]